MPQHRLHHLLVEPVVFRRQKTNALKPRADLPRQALHRCLARFAKVRHKSHPTRASAWRGPERRDKIHLLSLACHRFAERRSRHQSRTRRRAPPEVSAIGLFAFLHMRQRAALGRHVEGAPPWWHTPTVEFSWRPNAWQTRSTDTGSTSGERSPRLGLRPRISSTFVANLLGERGIAPLNRTTLGDHDHRTAGAPVPHWPPPCTASGAHPWLCACRATSTMAKSNTGTTKHPMPARHHRKDPQNQALARPGGSINPPAMKAVTAIPW